MNNRLNTASIKKGNSLKGVKILEMAWVLAGPVTGKYFADNGATVLRVESAVRPDLLRVSEPFRNGKTGMNRSAMFAFYGSNKLSMALNLKHPRAMEILHKLIKWADVITENFAPGKMEEFGLGYEEIKKIKSDIIMLRLSIQGQTGPHSRHPGYGVAAAGLSGITGLCGWTDRIPSTPVAGYTDLILPRFAAVMVLAALDYRRRTGKGQCVDATQLEATQQFLIPAILDYTVNGSDTTRQGNFSRYAAPHNAYQCRGDDRWCVISVFSDEEWQSLCRVMGKPDLAGQTDFVGVLSRKENEKEIDKIISGWTINHTAGEVVEKLQEAKVPAGVVQNAEDLLKDQQLSRMFWTLDHPELGPVKSLGQAFLFSKPGRDSCTPAPCLGEHTEYACRNILGMSDEEFIELFTSGVFE
ncbi:MAG: CoA transferase [Deltaproteobacteria bacterium]|nr:CoA transferase [Deltaproteobacteria bacterium]